MASGNNTKTVKADFKTLLDNALKESGRELSVDKDELAVYAAERAAILATVAASGETGFEDVLKAERDNVALKAGLVITKNASAVDQRLLGLIQGFLMMGARAL